MGATEGQVKGGREVERRGHGSLQYLCPPRSFAQGRVSLTGRPSTQGGLKPVMPYVGNVAEVSNSVGSTCRCRCLLAIPQHFSPLYRCLPAILEQDLPPTSAPSTPHRRSRCRQHRGWGLRGRGR